jgi:small subunit ribosomal protein S20
VIEWGYEKHMAITRGAKKALRVSKRKSVVNDTRRRLMKEAVKVAHKDIAGKDTKALKTDLALAFKALDKAAQRGVIKKGTANRKKARLAKAVAKMQK